MRKVTNISQKILHNWKKDSSWLWNTFKHQLCDVSLTFETIAKRLPYHSYYISSSLKTCELMKKLLQSSFISTIVILRDKWIIQSHTVLFFQVSAQGLFWNDVLRAVFWFTGRSIQKIFWDVFYNSILYRLSTKDILWDLIGNPLLYPHPFISPYYFILFHS